MATILKASGEKSETQPANGTHFRLAELQAIVGGYVEVVSIGGGQILIVHEEGRCLGLPFNARATALYKHDIIVGDVLLCEAREVR